MLLCFSLASIWIWEGRWMAKRRPVPGNILGYYIWQAKEQWAERELSPSTHKTVLETNQVFFWQTGWCALQVEKTFASISNYFRIFASAVTDCGSWLQERQYEMGRELLYLDVCIENPPLQIHINCMSHADDDRNNCLMRASFVDSPGYSIDVPVRGRSVLCMNAANKLAARLHL